MEQLAYCFSTRLKRPLFFSEIYDILSETEKDTEKVPGKLWSLAEIDALLADEGLSESEDVYKRQHYGRRCS